jgi:hypothetical protein
MFFLTEKGCEMTVGGITITDCKPPIQNGKAAWAAILFPALTKKSIGPF